MYEIGSIILVEYQIFTAGYKNSKHQIDHCKYRPAIVIAEDEENFYYLTLTSTKERKKRQSEVIYKKLSYINLSNIYSKEVYGAIERAKLSDKDLLQLLIKFYNLHSNLKNKKPMFKKIEKIVLNEIKDLTIKTQKSHRK